MGRKCKVCGKGASYGREGTAINEYCKEHGLENGCILVRKSQKNPCIVEGCKTVPTYGKDGTRKMTHCHKHGVENGMVRLLFTECKVEKCRNKTKFGMPGGVRTHCDEHKEEGMVDCTFPTCLKCGGKPTHAAPDDDSKEVLFCQAHAPEGWIFRNLRHCEICGKSASFGIESHRPKRCSIHRCHGMIDVCRDICSCEGCEKYCVNKIEGMSKAIFCGECCRMKGLQIIHGRQCEVDGCQTVPIFGPEGSTIGIRCKKHAGDLGYIDVMNRQCQFQLDGIRCLAQVHHGNIHCAMHDPLPRNRRNKETKVADWLSTEFEYPFSQRDKSIEETSCGRYRPDFRWELETHTVILEVDEHQHAIYQCDAKRMVDIFNSCGGQAVIFVRFNPDKFRLCGSVQSPPLQARFPLLKDVLTRVIQEEPLYQLAIHRLYFDDVDSHLTSSYAKWDNGKFQEYPI